MTEFCSDTLTDLAIKHPFNSHSEPALHNYFNFIVCPVSDFIPASSFVNRHVYFNQSFF